MAKMIERGELGAISAECINYLATVVRDPAEDTKHRVAAARCCVAHHEWREDFERPAQPEAAFFALMGGTDAAAQWLAQNYERLKLLAEGKASALAPGDGELSRVQGSQIEGVT